MITQGFKFLFGKNNLAYPRLLLRGDADNDLEATISALHSRGMLKGPNQHKRLTNMVYEAPL